MGKGVGKGEFLGLGGSTGRSTGLTSTTRSWSRTNPSTRAISFRSTEVHLSAALLPAQQRFDRQRAGTDEKQEKRAQELGLVRADLVQYGPESDLRRNGRQSERRGSAEDRDLRRRH